MHLWLIARLLVGPERIAFAAAGGGDGRGAGDGFAQASPQPRQNRPEARAGPLSGCRGQARAGEKPMPRVVTLRAIHNPCLSSYFGHNQDCFERRL